MRIGLYIFGGRGKWAGTAGAKLEVFEDRSLKLAMADLEWKTDISEKDSGVQGTVDDDSDEDGSVSSHEIVGKKARKRRRRACGVCPGCVREDCGRCSNCRDMVKFGGTGCKKKRCIRRRCTPPVSIDPVSDGVVHHTLLV